MFKYLKLKHKKRTNYTFFKCIFFQSWLNQVKVFTCSESGNTTLQEWGQLNPPTLAPLMMQKQQTAGFGYSGKKSCVWAKGHVDFLHHVVVQSGVA